MTTVRRFAIYSQDYILVRGENGPRDIKQRATGPIGRMAATFASRADAKKFLREVLLPDARAEGYQTVYWIKPYQVQLRGPSIREMVERVGDQLTYTWHLDGLKTANKRLAGWKGIPGRPGCFVTGDKAVAAATAARLGLPVEASGAHEIYQADRCLT